MSSHDSACYCHGTRTGFCIHRCRCDGCRAANTAYMAALRAEKSTSPVPEHVHGTANGYDNYECRCDECRAGNASRQRAYMDRKRAGAS